MADPDTRATLLVVDDEEIIRDLLARTFEGVYTVRTAASGSEALAQVALRPVDLLITDQKMPGLTGVELIVKAREIQPDLEAIVLSAYTDPPDLIQAINEGRVYRYVTKPWNTPELLMTVRNALEAVRLRREREELVRRLERRLEALSILYEVTSQAGAPRSYAEIIDTLTQSLHRILGFDLAASLIVVREPKQAVMHLHCRTPVDEATLLQTRDRVIEVYGELTGSALHEGELLMNLTGERLAGASALTVRSATHVPLMVDGKPVGLVYLASGEVDAFPADDQKLLYILANQTSDAVRRLAQRIEEERRKMALMVESMADGVVMTDESNEVYLINPSARRLLGIEATVEVTTRFLKERLGFYPFDLVRGWELSGAETLREEIKVGERILHSILSPVIDPDGKLVGVVVVLRDITEQKELERQKDEFVSIVSHELRTPLTSIAGSLDIVLKAYAGGLTDKQRRYLEMARESCSKLNMIVDDLLDVTKFERGKLSMRMGAVRLDALVFDAVEKYRPAAEEKKVQLTYHAERPSITLVADADRLMQVLGNLLSNAIKFTPPEEGRIDVEVFGPNITDRHVGVSVWNNGESIPESAQERVFDKFEQVRSEGTRHIGGTGLGLAISRGIVEAHGGRIWVEQTGGQGTKFVFTLPAAPEPAPPVEAEAPHEAGALRRHVLVVDDDRYTTYILKGLLMAAGHKVSLAHDGEAAIALAREKHPDLVTVDLRMPGVDGFQLVEILKHDPETSKLPVVVLTVLEERDRQQLQAADALLAKPINVDEFQAVIARLLAERSRARQARILVVDDDPGIRMICGEVLENAGYVVRDAETGAKALTEARRWRPDLILLDVMLPEMDGFTVAKRLREERATAVTPVIFISARGQTKDKVQAFKLGADDYLVKPFDAAELQARVEKALERREREYLASPTTRLPGSQAIEQEIVRRLAGGGDFAFCYLDLDNLKAVNDYYGYAKADGIIKQTGDLVREVIAREGSEADFIGHIAGDDFVFITTTDRVDTVCRTLIETFDRLVPLYYNKVDRERGFIETLDRYGDRRKFAIMSVSIAALCGGRDRFASHNDLATAAAELKRVAKAIPGSAYVRDGVVVVPAGAAAPTG
ncbi:MAG: response regulator [Deltaproteobacteria bacterium]|nr:response regulator [Deltaproteobacteria bacterium]